MRRNRRKISKAPRTQEMHEFEEPSAFLSIFNDETFASA